jgi:GNAT superfamily N-acetyltransferase
VTPPLVHFAGPDAPLLLELSESIGWPHEIGDWQTTLAASEVFGHRAADGKIVSSASIYQFAPDLAALAVVLVREDFRRQGLARAAVLKCLDQVPGVPQMLVATEFGQPLYESLGFKIAEQIVRLIAVEGTTLPVTGVVKRMTEADLPRALQLDHAIYQADRSQVLRHRWAQVETGVMLADGSGYAWRIPQRGGLVLGPVVATNPQDAASLVAHLTASFPGRIKIEVPERHAQLMAMLTSAGFVVDSSRPLMLKNVEHLPGRRELLFGLASLGFC